MTVRVIPLCPMTAKVVLANSSRNDGQNVRVRGRVEAGDEWPIDRIVAWPTHFLERIASGAANLGDGGRGGD